ncbi:discoidin domain-containing protein [Kribbella sp. CA-293567]|uniref:discoidin domain-containing protein n=1 Tax=Kribbella sp. CA-293567 TaxID=3002436 RepID=UPI0022DDD88A|nr:discoidin domain-containing protein [Kribbella sp. CA-293567]WBQ03617.1 discoidin domain-containing protein [Kribbella sp. CA-293567]
MRKALWIAAATAVASTGLIATAAQAAVPSDVVPSIPGCTTAPSVARAVASTAEDINPAAHAVDGSLSTRWSGYGEGAALTLDLGTAQSLCGVKIAWYKGDQRWNDHTIYTSTDGTTYTKVWAGRSSGGTADHESYPFAEAVSARYVRISFWQSAQGLWGSISEARALTAGSTEPPPAGQTKVVAAVGDIANSCTGSSCPQAKTAARVKAISPDSILTLGDQANGAYSQFTNYFAPSWGPLKDKVKPTPGNHEYDDSAAAGYFRYFGSAAKPNGTSWYSFDLGDWHIVSLNSEDQRRAGSSQLEWLKSDLAASNKRCVLAYWHRPKFSSGSEHGNFPNMKPFWDTLYAARAELILNGHDHDYERFAPQTPDGAANPAGPRQFVVGTGGSALRPFKAKVKNSEVRIAQQHGVLRLELASDNYSWKFVTAAGAELDSGSAKCN